MTITKINQANLLYQFQTPFFQLFFFVFRERIPIKSENIVHLIYVPATYKPLLDEVFNLILKTYQNMLVIKLVVPILKKMVQKKYVGEINSIITIKANINNMITIFSGCKTIYTKEMWYDCLSNSYPKNINYKHLRVSVMLQIPQK